jgi:hypothetical protein
MSVPKTEDIANARNTTMKEIVLVVDVIGIPVILY